MLGFDRIDRKSHSDLTEFANRKRKHYMLKLSLRIQSINRSQSPLIGERSSQQHVTNFCNTREKSASSTGFSEDTL